MKHHCYIPRTQGSCARKAPAPEPLVVLLGGGSGQRGREPGRLHCPILEESCDDLSGWLLCLDSCHLGDKVHWMFSGPYSGIWRTQSLLLVTLGLGISHSPQVEADCCQEPGPYFWTSPTLGSHPERLLWGPLPNPAPPGLRFYLLKDFSLFTTHAPSLPSTSLLSVSVPSVGRCARH